MFEKSLSYFEYWASLFSRCGARQTSDQDSELGLIQDPVETSVRSLYLEEVYLSSLGLMEGRDDLNLLGPIRHTDLDETLAAHQNIFTSTNPTFIHFLLRNHWVFCLLIPNEQSMQCFLIESFDQNTGEIRNEYFQEIFNTFKTGYEQAHLNAPTPPHFNSRIIYTGHQDTADNCGLCVLLGLKRILDAISQGASLKTAEDLQNILIPVTDGQTVAERENFICSTTPSLFNLDVRDNSNEFMP